MKTKNSNSISSDTVEPYSYQDYIAVDRRVAFVQVQEAEINDLPSAPPLFRPMCYLVKEGGNEYSFYASIIVPRGSTVRDCTITQINATNFVYLLVEPGPIDVDSLFFMVITGMPAPVGFQLSSVRLTVKGESTGGGGTETPPQGQGKTAVVYQDADELP